MGEKVWVLWRNYIRGGYAGFRILGRDCCAFVGEENLEMNGCLLFFQYFAYWNGICLTYIYFLERNEEDGVLPAIFCFFWPIGWICKGIRCIWNGRKKKLLAATTSAGYCIYDNEGRRIVGMKDVEVNGKWSN